MACLQRDGNLAELDFVQTDALLAARQNESEPFTCGRPPWTLLSDPVRER